MPDGNLVSAEEGAQEDFALTLGKLRQEWVQDADVFPEPDPAMPGVVAVFVFLWLDRIMDDSVVRSTCSAKDKMASGSGEIVKCCRMSCGKEE